MNPLRKLLIVAAGVLLLAACDGKPPAPKASFANTDITGLDYAKSFQLTDHTGQPRSLADYRGKVVLVFFGFTQCPDVCPTTLAEMADLKKQLGADGDKLQVVFVSVDPERDTQEVLASFVPAFDPSFVGLRGSAEQTAQIAKDFKIFVQKVAAKDGQSYSIDHTAGSYLFDQQGRLRLFVRHGQREGLLNDIRQLMAGA
ncbi:MAG: SCO family protein [Burkholderiaceae bacterium]|nr:SCO family protein [Burkholderiaceae bacterium]